VRCVASASREGRKQEVETPEGSKSATTGFLWWEWKSAAQKSTTRPSLQFWPQAGIVDLLCARWLGNVLVYVGRRVVVVGCDFWHVVLVGQRFTLIWRVQCKRCLAIGFRRARNHPRHFATQPTSITPLPIGKARKFQKNSCSKRKNASTTQGFGDVQVEEMCERCSRCCFSPPPTDRALALLLFLCAVACICVCLIPLSTP